MKKWIALLLAAVMTMLACATLADELDDQVDLMFRKSRAVGGAFVVAKAGEIVYEHYYGVQQTTTHVPVSAQSYMRCASVTKLVTGIGVMRLIDEGILAPDEDISKYLGYTVYNPRYPKEPITLRMLMSHTSGINESGSYSSIRSILSDMLDVNKKARANFRDVRPGTEYKYSNFGAGTVGAIIESVTGQYVSDYMREAIFEPLGIDASYGVWQLENEADICATYNTDGSLNKAPSYMLRQPFDGSCDPDTHYRITVGSLWIRARDLCRLGIALCGDGSVDGVQVLSPNALDMMRTPNSPETTGITAKSPYSFFTIQQDTLLPGRTVYGHQGTDSGVVCNLYYEPESELVITVMSNGCSTVRDDGIMTLTRRLAAIAAQEWM